MATARGLPRYTLTLANGTVINLTGGIGGSCYIESKELDMENPKMINFVDLFRLEFEDENFIDANFILKHRDARSSEDPLVTEPAESIVDVTYPQPTRPPDAVFWTIRIEDNFIISAWKLGGVEIYGGEVGPFIE